MTFFVLLNTLQLIKYLYWRYWLKKNAHRKFPWEEKDSDLYQYPKTDKYQVYDIGKRGRREPQLPSHFSNAGFTLEDEEQEGHPDGQPDYCQIMGEK